MRKLAALCITMTALIAAALALPKGGRGDDLAPRAFLPLVVRNYPPPPQELRCEPNDIPQEACSIERGSTYLSWMETELDIDWFYFDLAASGAVVITMRPPAGKDYDICLYPAPPHTPVTCSTTRGDGEESIRETLEAGRYYLLVYSFAGAGSKGYELGWR